MTERFEIEGDVGSGGMANVVRARDTDLGRQVAIKRLHRHIAAEPDAAARFKREALSAASLSHPGIVTVYDVGEDTDGPFIVMEFVEGETLTALMTRDGPLTPEAAAGVALQVARALDHAHQRGVIHRDVKPGNILLDVAGTAKLADFGIATGLADQARFTEVGQVLGTIAYLAPERVAGEPATPASDIYSLGVVLYEMLTGRIPFEADTPGAMIASQQQGRFDLPRDVADAPPGLDAIVVTALETDPADRFDTAAAFADRLEAWITDPVAQDAVAAGADASPTMPLVVPPTQPLAASDDTGAPAPPPPPHKPAPAARRGPWVPLVAGIALGALIVLLITQLGSPEEALGGATTTTTEPSDDPAAGDDVEETTTSAPEDTTTEPETTTTEPETTTTAMTLSVEQTFVDLGTVLADGRANDAIAPPAFNALSSLAEEAAEEWRDDDPEDAAEALAEFDLRAIDEFLRGRIESISTLVDLLIHTQLIREVAGLPDVEFDRDRDD